MEQEQHRGTVILVLGILGLLVCQICGIIAWIMANGDLQKMDAGVMDPEGRDMTNAGKICGIISVVILALAIVGTILFFAFGIGLAAMSGELQPD